MPAPANDDCTTAITVVALPYNHVVDASDASHGPASSCEPDIKKTVWYKYTAPNLNPIVLRAVDSESWGTIIAVYSGSCAGLVSQLCSHTDNNEIVFTPPVVGDYWIQVGTYDGIPTPFTYTIDIITLPSLAAPSFAIAQVPSHSAILSQTWTVFADAGQIEIQRWNGTTSAWEIVHTFNVGVSQPQYNAGLKGGTTYSYRARKKKTYHNGYVNYSAFGSVVSAATVAGNAGVVQYGWCIKGVGGYGRAGYPLEGFFQLKTGSGVDSPGTFIAGVRCGNIVGDAPVAGDCLNNNLRFWFKYRPNTTAIVDGTPTGRIYQGEYVGSYVQDGITHPQARFCHTAEVFEWRGRTGSCDTITKTHRPDGYMELRWNGVVVLRLDNIALGYPGVANWTKIGIAPAGTLTILSGNGLPPWDSAAHKENSGMTSLNVRDLDQYTSGGNTLFNYDFTALADTDLFYDENPTKPWRRWDYQQSFPDGDTVIIWDFLESQPGGPIGKRLTEGAFQNGVMVNWDALNPPNIIEPPYPPGYPPETPPPYPPGGAPPPNGGDGGGGGFTTGGTGTVVIKKVVRGVSSPSSNLDFAYIFNSTSAYSGVITYAGTHTFTGVPSGQLGYSVIETAKENWVTTYESTAGTNENIGLYSNGTTTVTITNTFVASNIGGIYFVEPNKRNDTLYSRIAPNDMETVVVKIPDPYVKGFLLGD